MKRQNGIIRAVRAVGRVLDRVLTKITIWAITSTDDAPLVIQAPIPIFGSRSIIHFSRRIVSGLLLRKGGGLENI